MVIPQRPMTPIETRLVQKLLERALLAGRSVGGRAALDLSLGEMENNPQLVQVVPPNEVVVAIIFDVRLGTRCGPMRLCLPYNSIEPLMDRLNSQSWLAAGRARRGNDAETRLARTVGGATVALDAVLAHTTMTLSELRGLEVGDLVVTTRRASEPAILRVEGKAKFVARLGQHRGRRGAATHAGHRPGGSGSRTCAILFYLRLAGLSGNIRPPGPHRLARGPSVVDSRAAWTLVTPS